MKAIDTNILVRFLVGDDPDQAGQVYELFKQVEAEKNELLVPLPVVLELIWVLESAYDITRKEIIGSIRDLLLMPILKFEHQSVIRQAMLDAETDTCDLADLLLAHTARELGAEVVLTFDRRAARHILFERV